MDTAAALLKAGALLVAQHVGARNKLEELNRLISIIRLLRIHPPIRTQECLRTVTGGLLRGEADAAAIEEARRELFDVLRTRETEPGYLSCQDGDGNTCVIVEWAALVKTVDTHCRIGVLTRARYDQIMQRPSEVLHERRIFHKIVLHGPSGVGKSVLVARLVADAYTQQGATIGYALQMVGAAGGADSDDLASILSMWDMAGQERFKSMVQASSKRAAFSLHAVSAAGSGSSASFDFGMPDVRGEVGTLLVGTCCDLYTPEDYRKLRAHFLNHRDVYCALIVTSAKSGANCQLLKDFLLVGWQLESATVEHRVDRSTLLTFHIDFATMKVGLNVGLTPIAGTTKDRCCK